MGPYDFGLFSLSITVLAVVADVGNFGINAGIVNFVSKYLNSDNQRSMKFLKLGLTAKLIIGVFVLLLGFLASPFIATVLFKKPELINAFRLVFLGVGTTWLFSFTTSYYQATQKFISWGLIQIFTNSMRLIFIVLLLSNSKLNLILAVLSYITAPLLGFLFSFVNISLSFIKEKITSGIRSEFFNFNKWLAVSSGIGAFSSRTDTFVLGRLTTPAGIGIYSAANQLVQVIPQIIGAIGTVVAPRYSSFTNDKDMISYFKKLLLFVSGISIFILLCTPIVKFIIDIFFGVEYQNSFKIFVILVFSALIFLMSVPFHNAIIYYFSYPRLFSYLSVINFVVVATLSVYLTKTFGYQATAYAIVAGNFVNFLIPALWFWRRVKSINKH